MQMRGNNLRLSILSLFIMAMVLVLSARTSEAHTPAHKHQLTFAPLKMAEHHSCPLDHHLPKEPCPHRKSSNTTLPSLSKECGGNPAGTAPSAGYNVSKETNLEAVFLSRPSMTGQKQFVTSASYQPFLSDPLEHPPQSL